MMSRSDPQVTRRSSGLRLAAIILATAGLGACATLQVQPQDIPTLEQRVSQSATPDDLTRLGVAYHDAGRHEEARVTLQRAMAAGATDGTVSLYLGLASEELEDYSAARAAYEAYLATDPRGDMKDDIEGRMALVTRLELRQLAKRAIEREQQLAEQPPTPMSIAVLPFRLVNVPEAYQPLRTALAEMMVTDLGLTQLQSIERVRVQSILDEIVLAQSGVVSEETGARAGRLLRAENVVQGQLSGTGEEQISVDATVLDMRERTPGNPFTRSGDVQAIFDLEKQLVFAVLEDIGYNLTPAEREKIDENRSTNLLAFLAYGRGLEALDGGRYEEAGALFREATQLDPGFGAARVQATDAGQLSQASQTSTVQVSQQAFTPEAAPGQTLTQSIAQDVNPSPVSTVTNTPGQSTTSQTTSTSTERTNPTQESQPTPPITRATNPRIIIVIDNPTVGQGRVGN